MRWRRPKNLGNLALSQGALVVLFFCLRARGWDDRSSVIVATAAGFWILGCTTVIAVRPLLSFISWGRLGHAIVLVVAGGVLQALLASYVGKIVPLSVQFGWMLIAGAVCASVAVRTVDPELWRAAVGRVFRQWVRILGAGRS
jgi:hypothetical protein